ncbi:aminopeptidase [Candidatus Woesearchaeota archaeon]|nr:aminopeptidase [Candidatus Woesearchaeota archaeon]
MIKPINIILKKCLDLKRNESVLIVTDSKLYHLAKEFFYQATKITKKVKLATIPIPKVNGTEPQKGIAKEMLKYDVEILITTKSLSHTNARIKASKKGVRIVIMPGITKQILERTIGIDYKKLEKLHKKLADIMDKGKKAAITTKLGTKLVFSIKGRKAYGRDTGLFTKKGAFGNLPTGEIFIAPVEKTANGVYIVDASFAGVGKLKNPLKLYVKNGYVNKIEGKDAKKLKNLLNPLGKKARNIAEFGIGTNNKAMITGNILEDEKAIGTCHIALGNNIGFGGKVSVQLHLDGIIKNPTILIDNKKIMDNGKFLI